MTVEGGKDGYVGGQVGKGEETRRRAEERGQNEGKTEGTEASGNGDDSPSLLPFLRFPFLLCSLSLSLFVHLSASVFVYMGVCIAVCQYTSDMITKYNHRRTGERRALCQ